MRVKTVLISTILLILVVAIGATPASAHQTLTVGDYAIEYGWLNEPPISGQPNGVILNVRRGAGSSPTPAAGSDQAAVSAEDLSTLTLEVVYGDQSKPLTIQPLGEDTPGQFVAPLTPTLPGKYTLRLGGRIGTTDVNADVQPEEVEQPDTVQFPRLASATASGYGFGLAGWLGAAGLLFGLVGAGLAIAVWRKR